MSTSRGFSDLFRSMFQAGKSRSSMESVCVMGDVSFLVSSIEGLIVVSGLRSKQHIFFR